MKVLKAIDKIIAKITEALLILSVAFMTVVLSGNVFARFALHKSITSAEEIGKYCVVIMTFVALAYIAQQDKHVKISLFFDILSWKGKKIMSIVVGTEGYLSDNARKIRAVNLFCCTPCWLMYNILTGSIGGVINETLGLCSILLSIYRYGWKYMGENRFDRRK